MTWPLNKEPGAFGGLEDSGPYGDAQFAVLPIPFDGTSTWLKGADQGPAAILRASANMELFDIETRSEPWRQGIITMAPIAGHIAPEAMAAEVQRATASLIADGKIVVGLGGEHSVSIGLIRAQAERHPGLTVLQLDAHSDTRESYHGSPYNHACVMARTAEICDFVQVGIRSMDVEEMESHRPERTFFAHDLDEGGSWIPAVVQKLSDPVYVTIDLDVLDPSEMPSTGTPEPGGLRYRQITKLLDVVCRARRVVGFDVVELLPNKHNQAPDFLAARLVYQMMAYMARGHRGV
ncbi:MAG: agmatinase [Candidatus Krumholzibacteriia bacterium]